MRRVAVTGPAGAGKSHLAAQLGSVLSLPVIHLDTLYWKPGWVRTPEAEWVEAQRLALAGESWIVDAQYDDMLPGWFEAADTIVFIDASLLQCLWRVSRRRLDARPAKGVPAGSEPSSAPRALSKFLRNHWQYRRTVRPELVADLERRRQGQRVVVVRRGADLRNFLAGI